MEARRTRRHWTYAEFARLPASGSTRYEVLDGEVCVTPAPGLMHQRIVGALFHLLYGFARQSGAGEVFVGPFDVLLSAEDYLEPDLLFVRAERSHRVTDRGVEGAPDLVVEVLSPSTGARDRGAKLDRYRLHGVPECWLIDPDTRTVEVWTFVEGAGRQVVLQATDVLEWTPVAGATLVIDLAELLGG